MRTLVYDHVMQGGQRAFPVVEDDRSPGVIYFENLRDEHRERVIGEYNRIMGFEEISHTADWSVHVWAQDLPALFSESARAMNWLAGTRVSKSPRVKRSFEIDGPDAESLLVCFLSELIYAQEQENLAFDTFALEFDAQTLKVEMEGAQIESADKAIKAVTYHNLKIIKTDRGLETRIVFDV